VKIISRLVLALMEASKVKVSDHNTVNVFLAKQYAGV
jgi:hypothetical protein